MNHFLALAAATFSAGGLFFSAHFGWFRHTPPADTSQPVISSEQTDQSVQTTTTSSASGSAKQRSGTPKTQHTKGGSSGGSSGSGSGSGTGGTTTSSGGTTTPPAQTPTPAPNPAPGEIRYTAYLTGYGWPDNSPAGNGTYISGIEGNAGGTGTYADPITMAVGYVGEKSDYAPGTMWYVPNVRAYFKAQDTCASCHKTPGAVSAWLDQWIGGDGSNNAAVLACEEVLTGNHLVIQNPAPTYAVVSGSLYQNGACRKPYGDTVVTQ